MAKWNRLDIYERDGFRCRYCDYDGGTFEGYKYLVVDHIDPTPTGSRDDPSNVATCCQYCNSCKGNDPCKTVEQAREIVKRHDTQNRTIWNRDVKPRIKRQSAD